MLQQSINNAILMPHHSNIDRDSLVSISRKSLKDKFLVEVLPIGDGKLAFGEKIQGAIIFIIDPEDPGKVSIDGMKKIYNLTSSEAEICHYIVEGKTNNEIAEIRNVSPETIKSQSISSFNKTITKNRSELIKRALAINLPIDTS